MTLYVFRIILQSSKGGKTLTTNPVGTTEKMWGSAPAGRTALLAADLACQTKSPLSPVNSIVFLSQVVE